MTTLLCLEGDPLTSSHDPESTVCDAILFLRREVHGSHERRLLEAVKVRGAAPLSGLHPYTIAQDGITVYPRWESLVEPRGVPWSDERLSLGLPDVDAIVGGGLTAQTTTLVAGTPSVGKTLLGLHFLSAAEHAGEPALLGALLGWIVSAPGRFRRIRERRGLRGQVAAHEWEDAAAAQASEADDS